MADRHLPQSASGLNLRDFRYTPLRAALSF